MKFAAFLVGALLTAPLAIGPVVPAKNRTEGLVPVDLESDSVGSQACKSCHSSTHASWTEGRHSRMLQPASPRNVLPAFDRSVELHGKSYELRREGDDFFVVEAYLQSTPTRRRVDYTLGSRRVQHFLSRLDDGRIIVLPPSYDVEKKEWFHNLDIVDLEESGAIKVQVWNSNCYGCHASGEKKGFEPASRTYETSWTDFGTGCERCHGPGKAHAAQYAAAAKPAEGVPTKVVHPDRLDAETSTAICAQCHSLRDITQPGFTAGSNYYDSFTPLLEYAQKRNHDPAYWPNGRPRRFSNEAVAFWESQCFFKGGATCLSCHNDVHEPNIERNGLLADKRDSLCIGCHQKIADQGAAHSHHGQPTAAAAKSSPSCVSCHMPRTVMSLRHRMPDHTISIPAPLNTKAFGIPNACNECHKERNADWAESKLAQWFPNGRRQQTVSDARAFSLGGRRDPAAIPLLSAISADPSRPPLFRANALGHLRNYKDPAATSALLAATGESHPAIKVAAMLSLVDQARDPAVQAVMQKGLLDPRRPIRMAAALGFLNAGKPATDAGLQTALSSAMGDHAARARFLNEDSSVQLDLGKMFFLAGDWKKAEASIRDSMTLDPRIAGGQYFLGLAILGQGRVAEGTDLLRKVPATDPQRKAADTVLARLAAAPNPN